MTPNPDYNYPELYSDRTVEQKKYIAERIFKDLDTPLPYDLQRIIDMCQNDLKLCSLVAYKIAVKMFKDPKYDAASSPLYFINNPAIMPVSYCGGNMSFGRVFAINHCAFSSPDSIVGFRNAEYRGPQEYFKISKGLKYVGTLDNWVLFKLDPRTTDDRTGILYSPLEKNFTIEFAHFPHDSGPRTIFRWLDC